MLFQTHGYLAVPGIRKSNRAVPPFLITYMKHFSFKTLFTCLFAASIFLFTACSKDDSGSDNPVNPNNPETPVVPSVDTGKNNTTDDVVTGGIPNCSFTTAIIYGYVNNHTQDALGMGIAFMPDSIYKYSPSLEVLKEHGYTKEASSFDAGTDNRRFTVILDDLSPNTTYRYYAYAGKMTANEVQSFTTPAVILKTGEATNVTLFSASLHGSTNATSALHHGFSYSTNQDFSISSTSTVWKSTVDETGAITAEITDLTPGTTYYYRSIAWEYVTNSSNVVIGQKQIVASEEVKTFTTLSICPDNNHPHAIDLGLPSGTKWACCNVDASGPYEKGALLDWDQTYTAISKWGDSWCLPNEAQYDELVSNTTTKLLCNSSGTDLLSGFYFVAANQQAIHLPTEHTLAYIKGNYYDYYWSSTISRAFTICRETNSTYLGTGRFSYSHSIRTYVGDKSLSERCFIRPIHK